MPAGKWRSPQPPASRIPLHVLCHRADRERVHESSQVFCKYPELLLILQHHLSTPLSPRSLGALLFRSPLRHAHRFSRTQAILAKVATDAVVFLTLFIKLVSRRGS